MKSQQLHESPAPKQSSEIGEPAVPQDSSQPQGSPERIKRPAHKNPKRIARVVVVVAGLALSLAIAASYAGVQPFATYKDVVMLQLAPLDDISIPVPTDEYPRTRRFTGTYKTTIPALTFQESLTFTSDTVSVVDAFAGTVVYRYTATMQSESEGMLDLENIDSGKLTQVPMQYVPKADCLIMYIQGRDKAGTTYCR